MQPAEWVFLASWRREFPVEEKTGW